MKKIFIFSLFVLLILGLVPEAKEAKAYTANAGWETYFSKTLYARAQRYPDEKWNNKAQFPMLSQLHVEVDYYAQVQNCTTNELLADGATVPIGTPLRFIHVPHEDVHVIWTGVGFSMDTPYGHWVDNAAPPEAKACLAEDFLVHARDTGAAGFRLGIENSIFTPLNVNPPIKSVTQLGTAVLSAPNAQGCQVVESAGTIVPQFNFDGTYGKFYMRFSFDAEDWYTYSVDTSHQLGSALKRYADEWKRKGLVVPMADGGACIINDYPLREGPLHVPNIHRSSGVEQGGAIYYDRILPEYTLQVPAQTITFNLTAAAATGTPPTMTIDGPTTASVGSSPVFIFKGDDAEDDDLTYFIDWNADDGLLHQESHGPVAVRTEVEDTWSWSSRGEKTIAAYALDKNNLRSDWVTHKITITDGMTATCEAEDTSITTADTARWTAAVTGGTAPYTYEWKDGFDGTVLGTGQTLSLAPAKTGSLSVELTVKDSTEATFNSGNCDIVSVMTPPPDDTIDDTTDDPTTTGDGAVNLTVNKRFVRFGEDVTVSWDLGGSTDCIVTGPDIGSLTVNTNGSQEDVTITGTAQFTLTCPTGSDTERVIMLPRIQET